MHDPAAGLTWANFEARIGQIWGVSAQVAARIRAQVEAGSRGVPQPVTFAGPKRFLRGAGWDPYKHGGRGGLADAYGGAWWFDESVLLRIEAELSRIPLPESLRKTAVTGRLRAALAVCMDWNDFSEIWALEIPAGARLTGLVSGVKDQPVYSDRDPRHDPAVRLAGGAQQVFFLVKDPTRVRRYQ